jgi:pimeloyl-ACP methyl ester carboxylesterase
MLFRILDVFCGWFGFSPAVLLNITTPRWGYRIEREVPYGPESRHRMDLYLPKHKPHGAPVLLFFYGGGFISGNKCEYRFVGQAFASLGIIVGIADYGIFPDHRFPEFVEDGAKAAAFLHDKLPEYGGDPNRLFVAGHSAGAYIAIMLASNPEYLSETGADQSILAGAIGIAGPYDFLPITNETRIEIFGGPRSHRNAADPFHRRQTPTDAAAHGRPRREHPAAQHAGHVRADARTGQRRRSDRLSRRRTLPDRLGARAAVPRAEPDPRRHRALRHVQSCCVASRAPSASDSSFAHMIDGCTRRWNGPCAKPQSVPAMTFSRPRFFA